MNLIILICALNIAKSECDFGSAERIYVGNRTSFVYCRILKETFDKARPIAGAVYQCLTDDEFSYGLLTPRGARFADSQP